MDSRAPHGDLLRRFDADPAMVKATVGQDLAEGETMNCVLPGHDGNGWVQRRGDGRFVYQCECDRIERSLTEVYIARVTGQKYKRTRQVFMLWRLRQAALARLVALPPFDLPPLSGASQTVEKAHKSLRLYFQVRRLTEQAEEAEFTLARSFLAEWAAISRDEAKAALHAFVSSGLLVNVGKQLLAGGREANLYRLGGRK